MRSTVFLSVILSILILGGFSFSQDAFGVTLTVEGTPTIDGVFSPGEWDTTASGSVSVFGGGSTFYVQNDGTNLYLALDVVDATMDAFDNMIVRFDNTNDAVDTVGDNKFVVRTSFVTADLHFDGTTWFGVDSQNDATGTAQSTGSGTNFFEASFPLNSGDPNDFSLSSTDAVGFCLRYVPAGGVGTVTYPTGCVPATGNSQVLYGNIVIATETTDSDGDGVLDSIDNCVDIANPDQLDLDGDGIGTACDSNVVFTTNTTIISDTTIPAGTTWTINSGVTLTIANGVNVGVEGIITNSGTINNFGGIGIAPGGAITNNTGGIITNNTSGFISTSSFSSFTNSGTIDNSGTIGNTGEFDSSGTINNAVGGILDSSGVSGRSCRIRRCCRWCRNCLWCRSW